jgi:hypothetical protein
MIAHRPESLALCRTVVRLDEGRLDPPATGPAAAFAR